MLAQFSLMQMNSKIEKLNAKIECLANNECQANSKSIRLTLEVSQLAFDP